MEEDFPACPSPVAEEENAGQAASAAVAAPEAANPRRGRRHEAQRQRRRREHQVRCSAVGYAREAAARKVSRKQVSRRLGVAPRTLRHWMNRDDDDPLQAVPRGRPVLTAALPERNEVVRFLQNVSGPSVGLPALRAVFPKIQRAVLADLLVRYRRVWRKRYRRTGFRLTWNRPGTVWAMDFTEPNHAIDGVFPYLFALRDLASHRQLAWQPVRGQTADDVLPVLRRLFAEHGAPLVLKNDNGSAFLAEVTKQAMREAEVAQLFSPPAHPEYNGQLERSNGVLTTYTDLHAVAEGHPFRLTSDDVAHGFALANTLSRPWGHEGPSPEEAWQVRGPISQDERRQFQACLAAERIRAAADLGFDLAAELNHYQQAELDRLATSRALESLGYLTKTRVSRPPKKRKRPSRKKLAKGDASGGEPAATAVDPSAANSPPGASTRTRWRLVERNGRATRWQKASEVLEWRWPRTRPPRQVIFLKQFRPLTVSGQFLRG